jgi:hypothetical protein
MIDPRTSSIRLPVLAELFRSHFGTFVLLQARLRDRSMDRLELPAMVLVGLLYAALTVALFALTVALLVLLFVPIGERHHSRRRRRCGCCCDSSESDSDDDVEDDDDDDDDSSWDSHYQPPVAPEALADLVVYDDDDDDDDQPPRRRRRIRTCSHESVRTFVGHGAWHGYCVCTVCGFVVHPKDHEDFE